MDNVLEKKLKVGISECCFGSKVRYNGKGFDYIKNFGREKEQFIFYPLCPECLAGLGVPRKPISIKGGSGDDVLEGLAKIKSKSGEDVTEKLLKACNYSLELLKSEGIYIYMYKEGSPSCGVYRTTLKDKRLGSPPGVFGAMLLREGFFLVCADDLESPIKRWDIRRRLNAFVWVKEAEIESKNQLYDVWHAVKFLCQELDEKTARNLGHELSTLNDAGKDDFEKYRRIIMELIRKPSTLKKIKAWLWKNYSYYRKNKDIKLDIVKEPTDLRSNTILAEELIKVENKLYLEGYSFGSSPILYRGRG